MPQNFDLIIVGGGLVGASLACALRDQPARIALIDSVPLDTGSRPDARIIALAYGSQRILSSLGLWQDLAATPIQRIHVSNRGHFGFTRLDRAQLGVEALGYVAEAWRIAQTLHQCVAGQDNLAVFAPARLARVEINADWAEVELEAGQVLRGKLLVAADGGDSQVCRLLEIPIQHKDYRQTAIIAKVRPVRDHQYTAYERFTPGGPLALLPLAEGECSLVWSVDSARAEAALALNERDFLAVLQQGFGNRLGRFVAAGPRVAYPLVLRRPAQRTGARLAIIGNAAHTLHPVAGQGLNLGLRDVAALAEVIAGASGGDVGGERLLRDYAAWRERDQQATIRLTDSLVGIFSNDFPPLALARNLGLIALDRCAPLKSLLLRQTAGLGGRQPRLARGLPLAG